ncbi:MAG: N-acetylneuraminate synthase family protein [Bacteroidia bacterium]
MKLIAETAMHHQGDFNYMIKMLDAIVNKCNCDYVKVHMLLDLDEYFVNDHAGYETTKNWMFNNDQWKEIITKIKDAGKKPMMLFNDRKAIDFGMKYSPELVEIHSVALNDTQLLSHLKSSVNKDTKIVLGVGGCTLYEIEKAVNFLDHSNTVLMFGFQNYPTQYKDVNFNKVKKIMSLFPGFEFGYADHTAWNHPQNILITLFGAAQGMQYVEKHVAIEHGVERADWSATISIDMFNDLEEKLTILAECNGNGNIELNEGEKKYSVYGPMKKAAVLNKALKEGDIFSTKDISFKRTKQETDISQIEIDKFNGVKMAQDLEKDTAVKSGHFSK